MSQLTVDLSYQRHLRNLIAHIVPNGLHQQSLCGSLLPLLSSACFRICSSCLSRRRFTVWSIPRWTKHSKITFAIVLGIFVLRLNGELQKPGHDIGDTVIQAVKVASTMWPILFAAVVGAMLKAITLYYAERGTNLGASTAFPVASQDVSNSYRPLRFFPQVKAWSALCAAVSATGSSAFGQPSSLSSGA